MQLILTQDVPHLGSLGDEVTVKDGYARNFLIPRGMAIVSSSRKTAQLEYQRRRLEKIRIEAIDRAKAESEKVASLELKVVAKCGPNGKLFGSVTNRDIQAALAEHGYELDRRSIVLHAPIKNVGSYEVTVRLHTDVKVNVGVRVEPDVVKELQYGEDGEIITEEVAAANAARRAESEAAEAASYPASEQEAASADAETVETTAPEGTESTSDAAPEESES